jgi:hypothetical protein
MNKENCYSLVIDEISCIEQDFTGVLTLVLQNLSSTTGFVIQTCRLFDDKIIARSQQVKENVDAILDSLTKFNINVEMFILDSAHTNFTKNDFEYLANTKKITVLPDIIFS